jgi:hypothetical protein
MESQVSRKKTQKYTKNAQEKPRKYKLPGLSVMNRHEKLLVRIKHVIIFYAENSGLSTLFVTNMLPFQLCYF